MAICSGLVRTLIITLALIAVAAISLGARPARAADLVVHARAGELSSATGPAEFPLAASAGETWLLSVVGLFDPIELAIVDPRSGAVVARPSSRGVRWLNWTAPESGVWRVRVSAATRLQGQLFTLYSRLAEDPGGNALEPVALAFDRNDSAIGRGAIDWQGDSDYFAVGMSAGNTYTIYTALGSIGGTLGDVLLPGADAAQRLLVHPNGQTLYDRVSPTEDGVALIRISSPAWLFGSYAVGVSSVGDGEHPAVGVGRSSEEHRLRGAEASVLRGALEIELSGDWAGFNVDRRVGVWLDVDADGEWDHIVQTRDGWWTRLWSIGERRWLAGRTAVGSRGFGSIVLNVSTRGFGEQVRWRAAARHTVNGWRATAGVAATIATLPPTPQRAALWPHLRPSGTAEQREAALVAAGVGAQTARQPVVVLDPGHGSLQTGPWLNGVVESHSNLALARAVAVLLEEEGVHVVLTRQGDDWAGLNFTDQPGRADLHARPELAHLADADLFISLHSNAAKNDWQQGLQGWYYPSPPGDGINQELARWMLDAVSSALADWGYSSQEELLNAVCWEIVDGYCDPIYVLAPFLLVDHQAALDWGCDPVAMGLSADPWAAPPATRYPTGRAHTKGVGPIDLVDPERQTGPASVVRGTMMPAALLEILYISHEVDAAVLRSEGGRLAIARGVAEGILTWLRRWGQLPPA